RKLRGVISNSVARSEIEYFAGEVSSMGNPYFYSIHAAVLSVQILINEMATYFNQLQNCLIKLCLTSHFVARRSR
ncbi:MAG: hypothetical protein ACRCVE_12050, partial [Plesiomonas sp.]